jgi:hypothetical protein
LFDRAGLRCASQQLCHFAVFLCVSLSELRVSALRTMGETITLKLDPGEPDPELIERAAQVIRDERACEDPTPRVDQQRSPDGDYRASNELMHRVRLQR